ncbi:MAG: hypothetical protein WA919_01660 [Coleofasciculaceae cyanobacterium]
MRNKQIGIIITSALLAASCLTTFAKAVVAQPNPSSCQSPPPDEYILLIPSQTWESHQTIQTSLPANTPTTFCRYLDKTVTRIGGFRELENANDWASYIQDSLGLSAFVVKAPPLELSTPASSYNPQSLGEGYAVLVDYFNRPEVAVQVQQLLGTSVGLASYGQRPYLLALYTTRQSQANSILRQLSDRGFWSMVVDSRRVTLLRQKVN